MLEVLESFERAAVRLSPTVLVLPGLVLTALGLFIWLGGLGFRRVLMGIVGAFLGGVGAFTLGGRHLLATVSSAVALIFTAVIFPRLFAALLLGLIGAAMAFTVVAWPALDSHRPAIAGGRVGAGERLSVDDSLEVVESHWLALATAFEDAAQELPRPRWALVALAGLGMLALASIFRRLGGAMACATVGTMLVFAGLVVLLMFKGAAPVTHIQRRAAFYGLVAAAMVAFGTLEQFVLWRRADGRKAKAKESESEKGESKRGWRGR